MSREVLREMASAIARLRRIRIEVEQVDRWAERLEENLAELELLAALAVPDTVEPAFEGTPFGRPARLLGSSAPQPAPAGSPAVAGERAGGGPAAPGRAAASRRQHEARPPDANDSSLRSPFRGAAGEQEAPSSLTLTEAARLLRLGRLSPEELVEQHLARIVESEGLKAYIAVFADSARKEARRAAAVLKEGPARLLEGIPLAIKDLMDIQGYAVTGGSRSLDRPPAPADAEVVARLRAAGAVVLGAANLHELAYGITSENPHFGAVRNPRDPGHMAGGSSGGSAAAVAAGLALGAVGTDTGGSIRIPAAACGVAGLKPTYGRASRKGVLPLSWSLDHVGPIAATTADVAALWAAMADDASPEEAALARCLVTPDGPGEGELPEELEACVRLARSLAPAGLAQAGGSPLSAEEVRRALAGLRFARPPEDWVGSLDGSVAAAWNQVLQRLGELGVHVQTVEPPPMAYIRAAQFLVLQTEAAAVHRTRLHTRPDDLGPDVRLRLQLGEFLMAVDYVQGQRLRRLVAEGFLRLFERVEVLVLPTLPVPAPPLGTRTVRLGGSSEPLHRVMTRFTAPFNQSGLPALSVPMGTDGAGLPLGVQLVGRPGREVDVLRAGMAVEALFRLR